jgi:RHS repeat-associated protein
VSEIPVAGTANMPTSQVTVDPVTNRITSLVYDADGNVVNDNLHSYAYNGAGQVTSVDGSNNSYAYDATGLRVNRNGTIYIYSGGIPIAEYPNGAAAGSPGVEYLYAGGTRVASVASGVFTYLYSDHLSTRVQASSAGAVTSTFGHFPFGESWYETGTADKWKFTTYEHDSESGLDYAHARFDSPAMGRFMSLDPLGGSTGNPQSLNRYAYVHNDPVNFTDPSGAASMKVCLLNERGDETNFCVGGGFIDGQFVFGSANLFQGDFFASPLQVGQTAQANNGLTYTVQNGEDGSPVWVNPLNGGEIDNPGEIGLPDNNLFDANLYFVGGPSGGATQEKSPARKACEAKEIGYADRVKADYLSGANDRIISSIVTGARDGAIAGAQIGFVGGEVAEPLGGGIPGAIVGGIVGGVATAGGAALTAPVKEVVNGFFYDHSIFGFGNTYQKQLDANIQKHCGGL